MSRVRPLVMRPAPTNNISASTMSAATNTLRRCRRPRVADALRAPSFERFTQAGGALSYGLKCRSEAEENAARHRDQDGECQSARVHTDHGPVWNVLDKFRRDTGAEEIHD